MERVAILCNAILLIFFANMAVSVVIQPQAYLSQNRQRRNTGSQTLNCRNGKILPADSSPSIKTPPDVTINGVSRNVWIDQGVKFRCTVVSNLTANVTWLFNGLPLAEQMEHRHSYLDCKMVLHIERTMTKDTGNYTCVVQNEIGRAMASSHLTVARKQNGPFIQYMGLDGKTGSANTAVVGSSLNLTCESQDVQVINLFKKDGIRVREGDASHYEMYHISKKEPNTKVSKLEIKNVTFGDTGNYTCVAWLKGFITTKTFYLRIVKRSSRPVIESFELQKNKSPYIGSKVNLTCKTNNAEAAIFHKDGVIIREGGRFTFFFENYGGDGLVGNIEIINVAKEDEGVFTCFAFKAGHLVSKTFTLKTVSKTVTSIPSHSSAMDSKGLVQYPQHSFSKFMVSFTVLAFMFSRT